MWSSLKPYAFVTQPFFYSVVGITVWIRRYLIYSQATIVTIDEVPADMKNGKEYFIYLFISQLDSDKASFCVSSDQDES